jgi:hypothetical protein
MNNQQQHVIGCLRTENYILDEKLGKQCTLLDDTAAACQADDNQRRFPQAEIPPLVFWFSLAFLGKSAILACGWGVVSEFLVVRLILSLARCCSLTQAYGCISLGECLGFRAEQALLLGRLAHFFVP